MVWVVVGRAARAAVVGKRQGQQPVSSAAAAATVCKLSVLAKSTVIEFVNNYNNTCNNTCNKIPDTPWTLCITFSQQK